MIFVDRKPISRRQHNRRSCEPAPDLEQEHRMETQRKYQDRRQDTFWKFHWLRSSLCEQLNDA